MADSLSSTRDPPHIAVKKLIIEQQMKNSAIFSIPLVGGGKGAISLNGRGLITQNQAKQQNQVRGTQLVRPPP